MSEPRVTRLSIPVGFLVRQSVVPSASSLVTRPTGRAVRREIQRCLAQERGNVLLLELDFAGISVMDFSGADEVVAKLLLQPYEEPVPGRPTVLILLKGIGDPHREPIEAVLHRRGLLAVGEGEDGRCGLLGDFTAEEEEVWSLLEAEGELEASRAADLLPGRDVGSVLDRLAGKGAAFREPWSGIYRALRTLVEGGHPASRET